jgi:ABC-2 type transport system permease protein
MASAVSHEPPTPIPAPAALPRPRASRPLGPDLLRAEWTKLRTVRSTWWALALAAFGMVVLGALFCARYGIGGISPSDKATFDPAGYSLSGFFLAQLAVAVLGVLAITSEYATGSIRATFAATPQRRGVLAAKAVVLTAITGLVGIAASLVAFFAGQAVLSSKGLQGNLGDPGALRAVVGAGLYLAMLSLLALGLGALIRSTVGATAVVVGLVFILPGTMGALPTSWERAVTPYLPSDAGQALIGRTKFAPLGPHLLPPWVGFAVVCAYTAAALIAAAVTLTRRDT